MDILYLTISIIFLVTGIIWMLNRDKEEDVSEVSTVDIIFLGGFFTALYGFWKVIRSLFQIPSIKNTPEWIFMIGFVFFILWLSSS